MFPTRCVVDTNVPVVANRKHADASDACVAACARALYDVTRSGHLFIDALDLIKTEYARHLNWKGEPGPGDAFMRWLYTNEWGGDVVTRVAITPKPFDETDFVELQAPPPGVSFDPSDRKFLAVAAAHPEHPPLLEAVDCRWWGWQGALAEMGLAVAFVSPVEIEAKFRSKGL